MPNVGDVAEAIGIKIPNTMDILDISEVDEHLPDEVKREIKQFLDDFKGGIETPISLFEVLGIQIPDDMKEKVRELMLLYGDVFARKEGDFIYLLPPPSVVVRVDEGNPNGDMFVSSWHIYTHSIDVQVEPVELLHDRTFHLEDITRLMRENVERQAALPVGWVAYEDIGISVHNPALSQLFAGEIGRMNGWEVMTPEQIASRAEGKDPPPSKKAIEWEERWRRKR